ncbi:hypothetical protein PF005_g19464 [Phytophthora fragariae]|uniref:Uncharacterized protein n=1 Tax=Phytophthora fragariae TaxID=53985 RepID=A0A6A3E6H2_9STRA|nr:hypothetical protein PF003_g35008 [Phytophthora fragariae]KAE8929185.1 hypothetical protein PF009_g20698 [Phytophthora fragariae]KAE8977190.1 hypothetical protein PF011_g23754 [Phytophthora fragariae]KAE9088776.1 hypothetical protein PF007_g19849 [Phytophthora fragariae]KAE9089486.1 hypothetical protein PF010_g18981 [Phytophthora fragariae]
MNALSNGAVEVAAHVSSANLDLVPTADEGEAICGAPIKPTTAGTTPATLLEHADKKLEEWLTYSVDWVQVPATTGDAEYDSRDLTPLLLVRHCDVVFRRVEALCE